ncbi:MAG TPA: hypothetical protein GX726_03695 [Clostridiales bacterium]|jgi:cell division protein FtsL|nr:hypothetical protein [Clostridiales bacterium]
MMTAERYIAARPAPRWDKREQRSFYRRPAAPASLPTLTKQQTALSAKDKSRLLGFLLLCGIVCIGLIIMAAYTAQVKYELNGTLAECDSLKGEISNLNVAIEQSSGIVAVEQKAKTRLGMVYPTDRQIVYVQPENRELQGFARELQRVAFNQ